MALDSKKDLEPALLSLINHPTCANLITEREICTILQNNPELFNNINLIEKLWFCQEFQPTILELIFEKYPQYFIDEVEEEILVLFGDTDEGGCDDNQDDMDEDENSWSPSPLIIDSTVVNEMDDPNSSSIKSSKPQPPVIEEENGKIKITEQFMRDLIR